jgi:hypothetical protein
MEASQALTVQEKVEGILLNICLLRMLPSASTSSTHSSSSSYSIAGITSDALPLVPAVKPVNHAELVGWSLLCSQHKVPRSWITPTLCRECAFHSTRPSTKVGWSTGRTCRSDQSEFHFDFVTTGPLASPRDTPKGGSLLLYIEAEYRGARTSRSVGNRYQWKQPLEDWS